MSRNNPRIHLALQFVIRNVLHIANVIAVRLGISIHYVSRCKYADACTLVHYTNDDNPDFHYYESQDRALNIQQITHNNKARMIQCLTRKAYPDKFTDNTDISQELLPEYHHSKPPVSQHSRSGNKTSHPRHLYTMITRQRWTFFYHTRRRIWTRRGRTHHGTLFILSW